MVVFVVAVMGMVAATACGGGRERTRAPFVASSASPATAPSATVFASVAPSTIAPEEPPVVLTLPPSTSATAESPPDEPPDPDALTAEQICLDSRQRALDAVGRFTIFDSDRRATLADLSIERPRTEDAFLDDVGPGYWGPADIDGDGVEDRVMRFTSVDFWSHHLFLKKGDCLRYAGSLEGYQIEVTRAKGGSPRARVFTYPIGPDSRVDTYGWNGASFQSRAP